MLNGQELIDRMRFRDRSRFPISSGVREDFESIQYLIPVIRKLKLDTTVDVVNAYLNNINGGGAFYMGECPDVRANEPIEIHMPYFGGGWPSYNYTDWVKKDVAAHGAIVPDELMCMARRYSLNYLLKLIDSIRILQTKFLGTVNSSVGEGIRVPVKFSNGLKQLRDDLATLGYSRRPGYEWHKLFLKLKDARINIFPDVQEREWFNSAFARWSPKGEDVVTAHSDQVGKSGETYGIRSVRSCNTNNINSVRLDPNLLGVLRELVYIVYPDNLDCLEKCNFDALADAMEILQYSISLMCYVSGASRLIDLESTAIFDKYSGSAKNLDESFYKLTPLAAILTAKCLSSSLHVDADNECSIRNRSVKLWKYFTVPGTTTHMPDNDIAIFIDNEVKRQKDLVHTYIHQVADKVSKECEHKCCEKEG